MSFEVNGTTELNYVYRGTTTVARATLFSARIRDMIYVRPGGATFDNSRKARANGAEVELEQQIGTRLKAQAGVSYVDAEDTRNAAAVLSTPAASTRWLGNLALLLRAGSRSLFGLHYRCVGKPEVSSVNANAKAYHLVGFTATQKGLLVQGLEVRAGVKNLFDSEPRYVLQQPNTVDVYAYPGRTYFLQLGWNP
ncbi:MAG: TonB-dependent receptor [Acidobacteria bacterium]|nr:TonB-dependent receptor [Acidobacteriota bacterium]